MWWLQTTRKGRQILREVLPYFPDDLTAEVLERNRTTYVLVKAWGDGWIEVFGERHVRAQVVGMPATDDLESERMAEEWVDLTLKPHYGAVNYPSWKRATEYIPPYWSFKEFVESAWWRENGPKMIRGIEDACK